jgi:hypothetical protein
VFLDVRKEDTFSRVEAIVLHQRDAVYVRAARRNWIDAVKVFSGVYYVGEGSALQCTDNDPVKLIGIVPV